MTRDTIEFDKIPTVLKRYSFSSKMEIAFRYSRDVINCNGINYNLISQGYPAPWDLETFTMMSIITQEWTNNKFSFPHDTVFSRIMTTIRDFVPSRLEKEEDANEKLHNYLMAVGLVQFDIQKNIYAQLYRYWKIFSFQNDFIDMPQLFHNRFKVDYSEVIKFAVFLWEYLTSPELPIQENYIEIIQKKWPIPIELLTISRSEYIKELNSISTDLENYIFCLRPSYSFPFIEYNNKLYLPLPHVIVRAVTSSLLFRLTDQNNELQKQIGKHVLEQYLFDLINGQDFDEVLSEKTYSIGHNNDQKTSDVMARRGNFVIFFDSKSFSPKRDIRIIDKPAIEKDINRLAKGCSQMYKQLRYYFQKKYNFFNCNNNIPLENRFGLVVVKEYPRFKLEQIYISAAQTLQINLESEEYKWLCSNIGIVEIDDIEKFCFVNADMLSSLINRRKSSDIYNHCLTEEQTNLNVQHEEYLDFCKKLEDSAVNSIYDFFFTP